MPIKCLCFIADLYKEEDSESVIHHNIYCIFYYFKGYGKTVSHVIIGLRTAKGTKQLKLDPSIYETLQKERVETGDVIYVEANSGAVKRQGRSDTYATEFDLELGGCV